MPIVVMIKRASLAYDQRFASGVAPRRFAIPLDR
jgi:hypothetical protein